MQQNTVEQLAHFSPVLLDLSSFVSLWLKRPSDYCSLLAGACPMPTKPETHKRLLLVFTGGVFNYYSAVEQHRWNYLQRNLG